MHKVFCILVLLLFCGIALAQDTSIIYIQQLPTSGVLLKKGWKFHAGDHSDWAQPNFNDSDWQPIDPTLELYYLPQIKKEPVGWLRIHLHIDSSLLNTPLAFQIYQSVASEVYLDGTLLQRYGKVSSDKAKVIAIQPLNEPAGLEFKKTDQVLAVRFSVQGSVPYLKYANPYYAFRLRINDVKGAGRFERIGNRFPVLNAVYTGLFIVLTIIHFGLFITYKRQKANLYFSMATLSGAIANGLFIFITYNHSVALRAYLAIIDWVFLLTLFNLFLFIAIHHLFSRGRDIFFWTIIVYAVASLLFWGLSYKVGEILAFNLPFVVSMVASLRIAWNAYRQGYRDSGIIVLGIALYFIFFSVFLLFYQGVIANTTVGFGANFTLMDALYQVSVLSVPLAFSFYLSRDFAYTSSELEKKLAEVQQLSAEKQHILISQNETLEQQVVDRTAALTQSLKELKATQAQLIQSEKMASLGELTAGIAHEIQNPLNFVNNFSEVNKELVAELKEKISKRNFNEAEAIANDIEDNETKINYHGKRADAIVKGMLQHSRASAGKKEATDLNALCDEYLRLAYHGLRAKDKNFNAKLETHFDESIGKVNVVPQDIGRVLLNLFNNAFYAVHEQLKKSGGDYKPTVIVRTKKTGDKNEIRVQDNGMGISKSLQDKIFQPFFTTKPTGQGTGLGLSLSYDIVKAHGGELTVASTEGKGTTFIIQLPIQP